MADSSGGAEPRPLPRPLFQATPTHGRMILLSNLPLFT